MNSNPSLKSSYTYLALAGILLFSVWANLQNNGFPLGYHYDEPRKVNAILSGVYEFHHPTLMIHLARLANYIANFTLKQDVVELGRAISALFGMGLVLATFLLIRIVSGPLPALLTALATALSPIAIIHSHYLKEDVYFSFFVILALSSLLKFLQTDDRRWLAALGAASGLALSAKYFAIVLFVLYIICPLAYRIQNKRRYFADILAAFVISLIVFSIINYPIFTDSRGFFENSSLEFRHGIQGHSIKIYPFQFLFTFHFVNSVIPGITQVLAFLALAGIALSRLKRFKLSPEEKVLLLFVALFYLLVEISPTKPFPDFMRYVLPIIPVLLYFAVRAIGVIVELIKPNNVSAAVAVFSICLIWPSYASYMYVRYLEDDTRTKVANQVEGLRLPGRGFSEFYVAADSRAPLVAAVDRNKLARAEVGYLMVASFSYDRFLLARGLWWQNESVYKIGRRYEALFTCPYTEIKPAYRSFAFSNPTIRIVNFRECPNGIDYP